MGVTLQLELNFQQQLRQAQSSPQDLAWQKLCLALAAAIGQIPLNKQLALVVYGISEYSPCRSTPGESLLFRGKVNV